MYRRITWVAAATSALLVSKLVAVQALGCTDCGVDSATVSDLLLGSAVVAGLYAGLAWLETAPLRQVALHLAGLGTAVAAVFSLGA